MKGNKIIVAIMDLKKIISIKFKFVEHNLTLADIKEKNNDAKQI